MTLGINYKGENYDPSNIEDRGAGSYTPSFGTAGVGGPTTLVFEVLESTVEIGRRGVLHQYPYRDEPWFEDFGRKARKYQVTVLVHGEDHIDQQDALIQALESEGVGSLILPNHDPAAVWPTSVSIINQSSELSITELRLSFVEAGTFNRPGDLQSISTFMDSRLFGSELIDSLFNATASRISEANDVENLTSDSAYNNETLNKYSNYTKFEDRINTTTDDAVSSSPTAFIESITRITNLSNKPNLDEIDIAHIRFAYSIIGNKIAALSPGELDRVGLLAIRSNLIDSHDKIIDNINSSGLNEFSGTVFGDYIDVLNNFDGIVTDTSIQRTFSTGQSQPLASIAAQIQSLSNGNASISSSNISHPMLTNDVDYTIIQNNSSTNDLRNSIRSFIGLPIDN